MRIGFDAKRAFHNATGLGNYSRDVIRLFTRNLPNDEFFLFDPIGKGIQFEYNLFNTQIITSQRKSGLGKNIWRRYGLKREISSLHLDVYHGLSNELPNGITRAGVKSIVTVHDLIFEKHPEWYPTIDRKIYRAKVQSAAAAASTIVAISEQTRVDLIDEYHINPEKIAVVYQGCNPIFKIPLTLEQRTILLNSFKLPERFVLYVGTIEERKNLHRLVLALAKTNLPLVVIGKETPYANKVSECLKGTALEKNYYHLKNITIQQLAALYQAAELFVYPSLYEGFGIPVIEALHSGTPVITGTGSMKEAGGDGCISVDTINEEALHNVVLNLWEDKDLQIKMAAAGQEHVKSFSDEALWNSWQKVYARL